MARVLKAKYFWEEPSFLTAKVKPNSSFVWKSILAAQDMIKVGACKRIGNGMKTLIWGCRWLPHETTPYVEARAVDPSLLVGHFINKETGSWNLAHARQFLSPRDISMMEKLVISPDFHNDWFWKNENRGIYIAKSAYRILMGESQGDDTCDHILWNRLWSMQVPPKMRVFYWRVAREILPTRRILITRGVSVDVCCQACLCNETEFHALVGCPAVAQVWQLASLIDWVITERQFKTWFGSILETKSKVEVCKVVFLMYTVWHARNSLL